MVLAQPSPTGGSRLGVIVGRRTVPRAVDRNWIKRQARETFRTLREKRQADVVVKVHQNPDRAARTEMRAELCRMLRSVLC